MTAACSRRDFVMRSLRAGSLLLGIGLTTAACLKKENTEDKKSPDFCDDYADVSESELEKRKQFAYTRQAPDMEKQCKACKLYLPPKKGEKCGGCTLFKGPVDAIGTCTYWAPLDV